MAQLHVNAAPGAPPVAVAARTLNFVQPNGSVEQRTVNITFAARRARHAARDASRPARRKRRLAGGAKQTATDAHPIATLQSVAERDEDEQRFLAEKRCLSSQRSDCNIVYVIDSAEGGRRKLIVRVARFLSVCSCATQCF